MILSHPRKFGDRNSENTNIFLKCGCKVGAGCGSACLLSSCPLGAGGAGFRRLSLPSCRAPRILVDLLLCSLCVVLEYALISRFKGYFSAFWGADVYLYGLMSLRGLWGFCTRVELGGFRACCDFLQNLSFCPFVFSLCPAFGALPLLLLGLSSCLVFPFRLCLCCFFFPFGLYGQKERAQFLASSLVLLCGSIQLPPELRNYCRRFQFLMNCQKSTPRKIERYCRK